MIRRVARSVRYIAPAIAALVFVAGCNAGAESVGRKPVDSRLRLGFVAEPLSLDFTQDDGAAIPQVMLVNVYEGLVKIDKYGSLVPVLAKDWTVSPDRKVYTFHLQENVKFSDGRPFTSADAKFSIDRVKAGWKPMVKAGMDAVDKVEAPDPLTLKVTLGQPSNLWLFRMATRIGAMFSRSSNMKELKTKSVGTGPYLIQKWKRGDSIDLVRNEKYWGKKPQAKNVTFRYFKDPNAMNNALRSGGLDVVANVQAPESLSMFSNELKYRVIEGTTNGEIVLSMNNVSKPFKNKKVRQAIKYGLDHRALMKTAWDGRGQLIGSMVPPTDPWYEDLSTRYSYDPKLARSLLDGAGYPKGSLTLRLRVPTIPYAVAISQVVKSQLADIGVNVVIDQLEFPARWLDEVFMKQNYDMSIISHVEPWDMVAFANDKYYFRYNSKKFKQLVAEADSGTTEDQIKKLKEAARLLSDDAAADFLFLLPNLAVSTKDVEGIPTNSIGEAYDLTTISKKS